MQLIKHVDCSWELTAAEIWTKCLFTSQFGSCQERPASGLHSLRWNVAAALRLPNQTAAFFFLPSSLFFFFGFFWVGVLFVSVATGGFILQDRTYHSLTGGGNEMVLSNDWMKKTDFFPSKLRVIFSPKKEKKGNTNASNGFKCDKWLQSSLLLKNNGAVVLSTLFSFRKPLIGSVEQQNCVYSS